MKGIIILWLLTIPLLSEAIHFKKWDVTDGLSNNTVKCITQDEQGFIWFGTFDGLCRFDGVNFSVYRHRSDDSLSLIANSVSALLAVKEGIWVGTLNGLNFFSVEENRFYPCKQVFPSGETLTLSNSVYNIVAIGEQLFILNDLGEILAGKQGQLFELCNFNTDNFWLSICAYKDGYLLAQAKNGLYLIDVQSKKIESYLSYEINIWRDNIIFYSQNQDLCYSGYGIGYATDVFKIHPDKRFEKVNMNVPEDLKAIVDYQNTIFFATDGKGLKTYRNQTVIPFTTENSNISSDAIHSLFVDRDSNLWVGTYRGGVNLYSDHYEWFQSMTRENGQLTYNVVTAVAAHKQQLYLGLDGGGLNICDPVSGKVSAYTTKNSHIAGDNILSVIDDEQDVWMGIYGKGLCRFSLTSRKFKNFPLPPINEKNNPNFIWQIKEDGEGHIWVIGRDVHLFDKRTETFITFPALSGIYASNIAFVEDKIWLSSTRTGIFVLDKKDGTIIKHYTKDLDNFPIASDDIRYLFADSKQNIWFSVQYAGLYKWNESTQTMSVYGVKNGLTDLNIVSMLEDRSGYFWIASYNGLFRLNAETETFIRFGKEDNLPSVQFNYNACQMQDDRMYFGTTNGLVYFLPEKIRYGQDVSPICFTDIELLNDENTVINLYGSNTGKIRLKYSQNFFTIRFSLPEFVSPDKLFFSCYMQNFEKDWRIISNSHSVVYTNVPPGEYEFYVRSTDRDGKWNTEVSKLRILITPPWWKTTWALFIWLLLAAGILFLVLQFYLHEMNIKQLVRRKEMEKDMEKTVNETKLRFFTNISHEFRTPLTLILSPLEALIKNEKDDIHRSKLSKIHKNAKDLLALVNQLLDFRKLEMKGEKLNLSYGDLVEFVDVVYQTFKEIADSEQKDLNLSIKVERLYMSFDKTKMQKILNNLLSNAFKYSSAGTQITLSLDKTTDDGRQYAFLQVADTGAGIPADKLPHVFERFYQIENAKNGSSGSGIGLHLVREYVELHSGRITVNSKLSEGSVFSVFIPADLQTSGTAPDMTVETQSIVSPQNNNQEQKTLLIVEDNDEFRQFLMEQLEPDYRIIQATDGEEGEQQALKYKPDLMITDIMMPKVDGIELCARIKNNIQTSHIPVILLTARASDEYKLTGYEAGADEYISKPFNFDILLLRIRKLITQQEDRKKQFRKAVEIKPSEITITSLDEKLIQKALFFIEKNMSNTEYFIDDLSNDIGMGRTNLYNKIQSITGLSPAQFIRSIRLKRAAQLLRDSQLNISEIADRVGFSTIKYFNIHFKEEFEVTPTQYRQNAKKCE